MLLFVVGIILGFGESREGRGGPPSSAQEETTVVGSVPRSPTHDGKDFDYWKPRMQRPFSDSERIEAIREVGGLIVLAMRRPDGRHWVADTVVPPMSQMLHDKSSEIRAAALGIFESYLGDGGRSRFQTSSSFLKIRTRKSDLLRSMHLAVWGTRPRNRYP